VKNNCEFLITVAMYNEKIEELKNTFTGICDNLRSFADNGVSSDRIATVLIADGIKPFMEAYKDHEVSEFLGPLFDPSKIARRFGLEEFNLV
jgi:hypothetical protein